SPCEPHTDSAGLAPAAISHHVAHPWDFLDRASRAKHRRGFASLNERRIRGAFSRSRAGGIALTRLYAIGVSEASVFHRERPAAYGVIPLTTLRFWLMRWRIRKSFKILAP